VTQLPWGPPPSSRAPQWRQGPQLGNPYGQNPYGQNPYGLTPARGQRGFGQNPFGAPPGGPYGRRPPPRRRHPFRLLVLAAIAVGLFMMGSTAVSNLATGGSSSSSSNGGAYQNEDYQVPPPDTNPPPIPQPETYEEAQTLITENPFYSQVTPDPVRCTSDPINVDSASDSQLKRHFDGLMECLVRVWQPPVEGAQFQIVRPTVTIYGSEITTKCGKSEVNAFYCGADQQVYYSNRLDDAVPVVAQDRWAADVVMAHEFGHALQARTAILISSQALGQQSNDEATQLSFSRRLETQADCLSGMFLNSVAESLGVQQSDVRGILEVYNAVGDDTLSGRPNIQGNHGLGRSREYWGNTGLGTTDVGACNTYSAKSSLVR
jgi:predicted metalloprotease